MILVDKGKIKIVEKSKERVAKDLPTGISTAATWFFIGFLHGHFLVNNSMTLEEWNNIVERTKAFEKEVHPNENKVS